MKKPKILYRYFNKRLTRIPVGDPERLHYVSDFKYPNFWREESKQFRGTDSHGYATMRDARFEAIQVAKRNIELERKFLRKLRYAYEK